jgi:DNA-binding CsgD family transcriptional regulator
MVDLEKAAERIEQGDAWKETDKVVQVEVKKPLDKVIPIRLPAEKWEELRHEAKAMGIGPTTLARMWILERLRLGPMPPMDADDPFRARVLITLYNAFRQSLPQPLTTRERQVLDSIVQGSPSKHIAEKLGISEQTVKSHITSILRKINAGREQPRPTKQPSTKLSG